MRLDWKLASAPTAMNGYRAVTDVVGTVSVMVDQAPFVILEDILVLEFASFVENWLNGINAGGRLDFYYKSMDEEEEPLLALNLQINGNYSIESCWSASQVREVKSDEAMVAFQSFSADLKGDLQGQYGIDIDNALSMLR